MLTTVYVENRTIGSRQHLCLTLDGKFQWVNIIPPDSWVLEPELNISNPKSLRVLYKLNGIELNTEIPEQYVNSMRTIVGNQYSRDEVVWQWVLPKHVYSKFLSTLTQDIISNIKKVDTSYHETVFLSVSSLFESLQPPFVNILKLGQYQESEMAANHSVLESFRPHRGYACERTVYDRFGARTGRLTVTSGPEILTLKKEYRDILLSSYEGGKIYYVDFAGLEARAFLSVMGKSVETQDVYTEIADKFLKGKYRRNIVKLAVLALLFGLGIQHLQKMLGGTKKEAEKFIFDVKTHFGVEILRQQLMTEWKDSGKIRNFYGRMINVPEENTIINSFIQSTGVDITLLGFKQIADEIERKKIQIKPLMLLHDAMFLDVAPECISELPALCDVGAKIPRMVNKFFIDAKPLEEIMNKSDE